MTGPVVPVAAIEALAERWGRKYGEHDNPWLVDLRTLVAEHQTMPDPAPKARLTDEEREVIAEPIYDAYRLGRYGAGHYLPAWHELEDKPTRGPEVMDEVNRVEAIVASRTEALRAEVERLTAERARLRDGVRALAEKWQSAPGEHHAPQQYAHWLRGLVEGDQARARQEVRGDG